MGSLKPGSQTGNIEAGDKLLIHPFVNEDCVFYGRTDMEQNAFVELTPEQISEDKYPFSFDDESVTFIDVGPKVK